MRLDDLIAGLAHIRKVNGNVRVLERRPVGFDSTELFKDDIQLDAMVLDCASVNDDANKERRYDTAKSLPLKFGKDRKEFKAFVIGDGRSRRK